MTTINYRGYTITEYQPYPRQYRYNFVSEEYTGDEDTRCGNGPTIEDCKEQIDDLEGCIECGEKQCECNPDTCDHCHRPAKHCCCDSDYEQMWDDKQEAMDDRRAGL